jgi:hypothetical protein
LVQLFDPTGGKKVDWKKMLRWAIERKMLKKKGYSMHPLIYIFIFLYNTTTRKSKKEKKKEEKKGVRRQVNCYFLSFSFFFSVTFLCCV